MKISVSEILGLQNKAKLVRDLLSNLNSEGSRTDDGFRILKINNPDAIRIIRAADDIQSFANKLGNIEINLKGV